VTEQPKPKLTFPTEGELIEVELTEEQAQAVLEGRPVAWTGDGDPFITEDGELGASYATDAARQATDSL
jgi:hypothetical protein